MNKYQKVFIERPGYYLMHYNHNHDKLGRFARSNGVGGYTYVSKKRKPVNKIYKTLSKQEQFYLSGGDDRPYYVSRKEYGSKSSVAYSFITKQHNKPISFIDIWANDKKTGEVAIAVSSDERGKGYANESVKRGLEWFNNNPEMQTLVWSVHKDNKASINLAKKNGFKRDVLSDYDSEWIAYSKRKNLPYSVKSNRLTYDTISKYKSKAPQLSHVRINKNTKGELFTNSKGSPVGMINTEKKSDGNVWIQGVEVFGDYKGKGVSKNLLDIAVNDYGATHLSVNKNNTIAKNLYDGYGFEVYDQDGTMYYMKLKNKK